MQGGEIEREWKEAWEQITWNTRDVGTRLSNIACTHTQRRLSPSSPPASSYPLTYTHTHVWVIKNAWPTSRSKEKCCSIFVLGGMWKIVQVLEIVVLRRGRWVEGTDGVGIAHVLALIESVFVCFLGWRHFCADCKFPFSILWPEIAVACGLRNQRDFLQASSLYNAI